MIQTKMNLLLIGITLSIGHVVNGQQGEIIFANQRLLPASQTCFVTYSQEYLVDTYKEIIAIKREICDGLFLLRAPTVKNTSLQVVGQIPPMFQDKRALQYKFDKYGFLVGFHCEYSIDLISNCIISNQTMNGTMNWLSQSFTVDLSRTVFMDFDRSNQLYLLISFFWIFDCSGELLLTFDLYDYLTQKGLTLSAHALTLDGNYLLMVYHVSPYYEAVDLFDTKTFSLSRIAYISSYIENIWPLNETAFYVTSWQDASSVLLLFNYDNTTSTWKKTQVRYLNPSSCLLFDILGMKNIGNYNLVAACASEASIGALSIMGYFSRTGNSQDTAATVSFEIWGVKGLIKQLYYSKLIDTQGTFQVILQIASKKDLTVDGFSFFTDVYSWIIIEFISFKKYSTPTSSRVLTHEPTTYSSLPSNPGSKAASVSKPTILFIIVGIFSGLLICILGFFIRLRTKKGKNEREYDSIIRSKSVMSTDMTLFATKTPLSIPGYLQLHAFDYRFIRKIQSGGSCTIHLVEILKREMTDSQCIAKVPQKIMSDQRRKEQFLMEVAFHHYLNTVSERFTALVGYEPDSMTMIMKFYKHGSLNEWIFQSESFSKKTFLSLLHDIASGLQVMHSLGFAHCDIKPENVLIDWNEPSHRYTALITDLGISRVVENLLPGVKNFHIKSVHGLSIMYAAPESILEFRDRDSNMRNVKDILAGDIYSFGILLHQCMNKLRHPWLK